MKLRHLAPLVFLSIALGSWVSCSSRGTDAATPVEHPAAFPVLKRAQFCTQYDGRLKQPAWAYYVLEPRQDVEPSDGPRSRRFRQDEDVYPLHRSQLDDYAGSGYDRGHMVPIAHVPAGDSEGEVSLLSAICPQHPSLNRGLWRVLEDFTQELADEALRVHVVCGPLFIPEEDADGKRYIRCQVLGGSCVAVPTHFFKAVLVEHHDQSQEVTAWVLPNSNEALGRSLCEFEVSFDELETCSGLRLFGN